MAQGLSSLLGGLAQGFTDLGKSTLDVLGGGTTNNVLTAGLDALINKKSYGQAVKDANQRQKDFRKWLYETDSDKDAAAKGLGTALNGAQTAIDLIPGLGQSAPVNAIQGAIGGLADEFKFNGENYDWGKGAQRAAVGAGAGLAAGGLGKALANSGSKVLSNGVLKGAATGSLGGALSQAGGTAIEGGNADQILQSAAQGAQFGALLGAGTGGVQSLAGALKKTHAKNSAPVMDDQVEIMAELVPEQNAVAGAVLSPEQKEFFKDSVIRDENGNLMPLYHGSNSKFTVFDKSKGGQSNKTAKVGHWFTPNKEAAEKWAKQAWWGDKDPTVYETYLNIKKPMVYEAVDNSAQIKKLQAQLEQAWDNISSTYRGSKEYYDAYKEYNNIARQIDDLSFTDPYERFRSDIYAMEGKTPSQANVGGVGMVMDDEDAAVQKYIDMLKGEGYDGIIIKGTGYDQNVMGGPNDQYVVFDSNQIKSVNNVNPTDNVDIMAERVAPGQLGLFDQTQTTTPKTATAQLGLFDQPTQPATPKTIDVADVNPYAPVNGQITDTMRNRASEIIDNLALKRQIPDNELFNRIDPATLPKGQQGVGKFLDEAYAKGLSHADIADMMRETVSSEFDKRLGKTPDKEKLISFIFGDADETTKKEMMDKELGLYVAPETVSESTLNSMARHKISDEIYGNNLSALSAGNRTLRGGYTGALDSVLSERLGIAPGNTYKKTGTYDTSGSLGRFQEYPNNPYKNNIMVEPALDNEDAINTMAHERLHSFQTEAKKLYDKDRYSPEVKSAYDELAKDLKRAKAYKTGNEIRNRYYGRNMAYWRHHDEQEARMLQQYLDAKGYTGSRHHNEKQYLGLEFDDAKITPAFDKFFDKLRDLSKKGVALPAILAALGLGEYATENQEEDKDNGQQI